MRSEGAFTICELRPTCSFAADRTEMQMESYARQQRLLKILSTKDGQGMLEAYAKRSGLHDKDTFDLTVHERKVHNPKTSDWDKHFSVDLPGLAKANVVRRGLAAQAATLAAQESARELQTLTKLANQYGWTVELKSMVDLATMRMDKAVREESQLSALHDKDTQELEVANSKTASWGSKAAKKRLVRQATRDLKFKQQQQDQEAIDAALAQAVASEEQ